MENNNKIMNNFFQEEELNEFYSQKNLRKNNNQIFL